MGSPSKTETRHRTALPTRWHVITGAPCSGKTTVIDALSAKGYATVPEAARAEIDAQLNQNRTLSDIKANMAAFEARVLARKQRSEAGLEPSALVFLDRGIPDTVAYCRLYGVSTDRAMAASGRFRYARVFCLAPLPYATDRIRSEEPHEACRLDHLIQDAYRQLAYDLMPVPVLPVDRRVAFILDRIVQGQVP